MPYLRNGIAYDHNLWYSCLKWWYIQIFISCFSKFWFLGIVSRVKGQKMARNNKKVCLSCFISQETYIIWFSFMVHMYKMISQVVFFILSKLWFSRLLGEYKGKKWSKVKNNSVSHTPYIRNHTSYDFHLCIYGTNDNISRNFFFFSFYQNFDFPGF